MIIGVGTDIIEIDRVESACRNDRFLTKYFTTLENEYFLSKKAGAKYSIAGTFAAKEAVSKALGTGFVGFGLVDIEILRDSGGKPYVSLHRGAARKAEKLGIQTIHLCISHSCQNAVAYAVAEG